VPFLPPTAVVAAPIARDASFGGDPLLAHQAPAARVRW